jgi:hypothetical protein
MRTSAQAPTSHVRRSADRAELRGRAPSRTGHELLLQRSKRERCLVLLHELRHSRRDGRIHESETFGKNPSGVELDRDEFLDLMVLPKSKYQQGRANRTSTGARGPCIDISVNRHLATWI